MPAWRRNIVTASANCAGFVLMMLGFRLRVRGWENFAKAKELGVVSICDLNVIVTDTLMSLNTLAIPSACRAAAELASHPLPLILALH